MESDSLRLTTVIPLTKSCDERAQADGHFFRSFKSDYGMEVSYMGCRTRVIAVRHGEAVSDGRGNLSFTTINLPRIAVNSNGNVQQFFTSLEEVLALVPKPFVTEHYP